MVSKMQSLKEQLKLYLNGSLVSGERPDDVLMEWVDIGRDSLRRWKGGGKIMGGEISTRLSGFLLSVGLLATEISNQLQYEDLYKGLGLKVITFDEVLDKIQVGRDAFTRFLRGEGGMSVERMQRLEDLIKNESFQAKLAEKLKATERLHLKPVNPGRIITPLVPKTENQITHTNGALSKEDLIKTAASMSEAILPLLLVIDSDYFSDDERREFRRQVSEDGIFRLSNCLSRLCSRTARTMCLQNAKGGE